MLADASDEEWATLLEHTRYRRFGPGDAVLTAGERDQPLYLVLEGQLEVLADHGRRIASVGADSVIGEVVLLRRRRPFGPGPRGDARDARRIVAGRI